MQLVKVPGKNKETVSKAVGGKTRQPHLHLMAVVFNPVDL
jgi:hypothetical protein